MAKRRTSQLLAELRTLAKEAGDNLYRRIGLAAQVMVDIDWIATTHDGSDLAAMESLTDEYFRDLGGYVCLSKLIAMHRDVPEAEWKDLRYDIAAVEVTYDEMTAKEDATEKPARTSWKKEAEKQAEKAAEMESQVKQLLEANATLREENTDLRAQVARMEGRIEEMDRMLSRASVR